jgi:serine/threonine protein kinase
MARFKNEAKAAGRLLHPNIVSVYEYGEDEANAFIVMEYVEGTGLREYLARKASFDLPHIASIMTQLLRALDFAHERGVIHRDIKPANLILTADGTLKVADFGIARVDTSNLTTLGMVMGTPSYMSPEKCSRQAVDRRTDRFSAAVALRTARRRNRLPARPGRRLQDSPRKRAAAVRAVAAHPVSDDRRRPGGGAGKKPGCAFSECARVQPRAA